MLSGSLANYVYEDDGIVKALLTFGQTADSDKSGAFEIWRIYVSQDFQGVGIGKSLLTFAEKQAMLSGFQEIIIWAFKENFKAVLFYKRNGYVEDKVMNLGDPYCAEGVRFCKRLEKS
ncbi:MAG: GNAT family N-acetyltransferase [Lachnospiraceae bacterium]|nr:GNAT family N-acetyltransferase [Lachnospiraceae bacterium]